jgi:TonB family protein
MMMRLFILLVLGQLASLSFSQESRDARPLGDVRWMDDFLCGEVFYPLEELQNRVEGAVVLEFVVEKDGKVSGTRVVRSVTPALDAEALRVFRYILWEPAYKLGSPVESANTFTFDFNIKKYTRTCKKRGYDTPAVPANPVDTSLTVYGKRSVDKLPYPTFENQAMTLPRYIQDNIRYPDAAYKQSISGKVILSFIVEAHGRISNLKVEQPLGGGCSQEAIRLVSQLKWQPGLKAGTAVRTAMEMEIVFKLPDDSDLKMFESSQGNNL